MANHSIICPICKIPLPADSTICPDCGEDLAALVHLQRRSQVLYNKGLQLAQTGEQERAILALEQALEADATNVAAMTVLGKLYALGERYTEARSVWERALQHAPEEPKLNAALARLDQLEEEAAVAAAATEAKTVAAIAAAEAYQTQAQAQAANATLYRNRLLGATIIVVPLILLLLQPLWSRSGINDEPETVVVIVTTTFMPTSSGDEASLPNESGTMTQDTPTLIPEASSTVVLDPSPTIAQDAPTFVPTLSPTHLATATTVPTATPAPTTTPLPDLQTPVETALLNQEDLQFLSLEVVQEHTIIRLIGQVPDLSSRYLAETTASAIPGVSLVNLQELTLAPTVTVQPSDTLWSLANRIYDSPDYWQALAQANNLAPPYIIRVGQKLMLPTP